MLARRLDGLPLAASLVIVTSDVGLMAAKRERERKKERETERERES